MRRRSRKSRADWVYRGNIFDEAGATIDGLGSYTPAESVLTPGPAGANVAILYDSHNRMMPVVSSGNVPFAFASAGRAEGAKARILYVQGWLRVRPSTWAVGSSFHLGFRFGEFEQDPQTGLLLVDALYTLWQNNTNNVFQPAVWANDRNWDRERRVAVTFSDNQQAWNYYFSFRVRRRLKPNMCYAFITESQAGSVNLLTIPFFRTLVADEGA